MAKSHPGSLGMYIRSIRAHLGNVGRYPEALEVISVALETISHVLDTILEVLETFSEVLENISEVLEAISETLEIKGAIFFEYQK